MDAEDVVRLIPASPAGKCGAGRVVEVQGARRRARDSDVLQMLPAQSTLSLITFRRRRFPMLCTLCLVLVGL